MDMLHKIREPLPYVMDQLWRRSPAEYFQSVAAELISGRGTASRAADGVEGSAWMRRQAGAMAPEPVDEMLALLAMIDEIPSPQWQRGAVAQLLPAEHREGLRGPATVRLGAHDGPDSDDASAPTGTGCSAAETLAMLRAMGDALNGWAHPSLAPVDAEGMRARESRGFSMASVAGNPLWAGKERCAETEEEKTHLREEESVVLVL